VARLAGSKHAINAIVAAISLAGEQRWIVRRNLIQLGGYQAADRKCRHDSDRQANDDRFIP